MAEERIYPESKEILEQISKVEKICKEFSFLESFLDEINKTKSKLLSSEIILPLVGEFSCGKSSLINSLLGINILPVDIPPTTFTVNEIRFSQPKDSIEFFYDGAKKEELNELKNLNELDLSQVSLIKIYSSKKIIPNKLVIVDPPGISSDIEKHNTILREYIPGADAVLLCIDVNQGTLTKIMEEMMKPIVLSDKRIFLVYLKADTKYQKELNELKTYAETKFSLKLERVVLTSAKDNKIEEFVDLIDEIFTESDKILINNILRDFLELTKRTYSMLEVQLANADLDEQEIEQRIKEAEKQLEELRNNIEKEINRWEKRVDQVRDGSIKVFEDSMIQELNRLVNIAFEDENIFRKEFNSTLKVAGEKSLKYFQQNLGDTLKQLSTDISERLKEYEIKGSSITSVTTGIRLIIDITIIASLIVAFKQKLMIEFIGAVLIRLGIGKIKGLEEVIEGIAKVLTRGIVENRIGSAISKATDEFKRLLLEESEKIIRVVKEEIWSKYEPQEKSFLNALENLKTQKTKKREEFLKYLERLRKAQGELECIKDWSENFIYTKTY